MVFRTAASTGWISHDHKRYLLQKRGLKKIQYSIYLIKKHPVQDLQNWGSSSWDFTVSRLGQWENWRKSRPDCWSLNPVLEKTFYTNLPLKKLECCEYTECARMLAEGLRSHMWRESILRCLGSLNVHEETFVLKGIGRSNRWPEDKNLVQVTTRGRVLLLKE